MFLFVNSFSYAHILNVSIIKRKHIKAISSLLLISADIDILTKKWKNKKGKHDKTGSQAKQTTAKARTK